MSRDPLWSLPSFCLQEPACGVYILGPSLHTSDVFAMEPTWRQFRNLPPSEAHRRMAQPHAGLHRGPSEIQSGDRERAKMAMT